MAADALVIFNKTDLAPADEQLAEYQRIGYETLSCSVADDINIAQIGAMVASRTAIMVGQSGVGKSSIINALIDGSQQRIGAISEKSSEGRHTTVNSAMLELPGGGQIIDSPGVRDYAPALSDRNDVLRGFREIAAAGQDCRFANCRHLREPHCAVKNAVENGEISDRRYESYRRLLALTERLETSG